MKTQAILLVLSTALLAGCSQETINSAQRDISQNTENVKKEVARAEKKAAPVIAAAKPVTDAIKREGAEKIEQAKIGGRVLAALRANENLPSTIRVDAAPDAKGVTLRGKVRSSEEKRLAEKVARATVGEEKSVKNDLTVE